MDIQIKWKNGTKWDIFPVTDILHLPRNHALDLFGRKIPVLIKQDDTYISNDAAVFQTYHKRGDKVLDLAKLERSDKPLCEVGFHNPPYNQETGKD